MWTMCSLKYGVEEAEEGPERQMHPMAAEEAGPTVEASFP